MSKSFLFLSDFDGTLTDLDFFHVIIDSYFKKDSARLYADWDNKVQSDYDFLSHLFGNIGRTQPEIDEDIRRIPFDESALKVIDMVQKAGGEFAVISAGTDYYIKRIFEHYGVQNVKIYSNPGEYGNKGIQMQPYPDKRYQSAFYGIDKAKLAADLMKGYDQVFFAGDSQPDLKAALLAHTIFAKGKLQDLLNKENKEYTPIKSFKDVASYLTTKTDLFNHVS